ncbi:ABC transporter ATP-binding protein [Vibrio sp. SM6]|uniref:ABC transporter ATP-binding protein n=2 Tax=Vibrio agarilyticus TaxID=2726741 RepID=A0A7X8TNI9_9VIBR|nr:ABC transporter ATP-binding protein [Vibrio agarilyticus]
MTALARPYWRQFTFALILLALSVAAEMAIPWLMKVVLDDVVSQADWTWREVAPYLMAIAISYIIGALLSYQQSLRFRHGALLVVRDVRRSLFARLLKLPMARFDNTPTGQLVSHITHDTESMRELFVSTLPTILQGSVRIVAIFTAMALLDWRLMLLSLALIPLLLGVMQLYRRVSMAAFDGVRRQVSLINGEINESLQGMTLIQAFNQQARIGAQFADENQQWQDYRNQSVAMDSWLLVPLTRLIGTLTAAAIITWFAGASLHTFVAIGTVYAFLNYIERFFDPFRQLSMELRKLQVASVAAKRVFELLDAPAYLALERASDAPLSPRLNARDTLDIEFRDVDFSYDGTNPTLKNVNLTVKQGSFTAIVGHTGSGKSSLINLLMRFYQPQQGEIYIGGAPLSQLDETERRALFGLVSQDPLLLRGSVYDNIALGNESISLDRAEQVARQVKADAFITQLPDGFHHTASDHTFSVGEKQLIALARVLAHDPQIYLLDEATANIDSDTELCVKAALDQLPKGRTVISVAHRLSTVRHADQILVFERGELAQSGTHETLIEHEGPYRQLYLAQQQEALQAQSQEISEVLPICPPQEITM